LDFALLLYARLTDEVLVLVVPAIAACVENLTSAEYTTTLLTHGFLPILALAFVFDRTVARGSRRAAMRVRAQGDGRRASGPFRASVVHATYRRADGDVAERVTVTPR
jgi:hypothetical protein